MKKAKNNSGIITALKQGLHDPSRVNVFLDNVFSFAVSAEEVIKRGLRVGQMLTESAVRELMSVSDTEKLFAKIVNYISYRPRSQKEVKDKLLRYGAGDDDETTQELIARLKRLGYLDDLAFAKWFVESRRANRPRSIRHLASELYAKGIAKPIIEEVTREGADEKQAIKELIAKKKGMEKDKLVTYLARRGFSWELIKSNLALDNDS